MTAPGLGGWDGLEPSDDAPDDADTTPTPVLLPAWVVKLWADSTRHRIRSDYAVKRACQAALLPRVEVYSSLHPVDDSVVIWKVSLPPVEGGPPRVVATFLPGALPDPETAARGYVNGLIASGQVRRER